MISSSRIISICPRLLSHRVLCYVIGAVTEYDTCETAQGESHRMYLGLDRLAQRTFRLRAYVFIIT